MAAPPSNLQYVISTDKKSITFMGKNQPGGGLVIVLSYSYPSAHRTISTRTSERMSLNDIASSLAQEVEDPVQAQAQGAKLTLTASNNATPVIDKCLVSALDDQKYSDEYIRGGIQIAMPDLSFGTLGCLATTAATAEDPEGKVIAITCSHVVSPDRQQENSLTVQLTQVPAPALGDYPGCTITFVGTNPIPVGTLIAVELSFEDAAGLEFDAFYQTLPGDTIDKIAKGVADAITKQSVPSVSANSVAHTVNVMGMGITSSCKIYGPQSLDPYSTLHANVVGLGAIEFTGEVPGRDYGIFTNVNAGGTEATIGVYYHPAEGSTPNSIAQFIAAAIKRMAAAAISPVTALAAGPQVVVSNAQAVECTITSNCRIGQPEASFPRWIPFMYHGIGSILDARIDVDTAIIQLDAGQKYKAEIQDIGFPAGTYDLIPDDVQTLTVSKRGRTTLTTSGKIETLNVSGKVNGRLYTNAVLIKGLFCLPGDSGSAVLRKNEKDENEVVGILCIKAGQDSLMTPISPIIAAFPALKLNLAPAAKVGEEGAVRIVPEPAKGATVPPGGSVP
jgi:hypothetical protein